MNGVQGKNPARRQCNILLDAVVTIIKYNKSTINHAIYSKFFSDITVLYLTFSNDDIINTTNNETEISELKRVFEEQFEMKCQEVSILKYLSLRIFQPPLGFSVDQTDHIIKLVNEFFPIRKFINFNTTFSTDS